MNHLVSKVCAVGRMNLFWQREIWVAIGMSLGKGIREMHQVVYLRLMSPPKHVDQCVCVGNVYNYCCREVHYGGNTRWPSCSGFSDAHTQRTLRTPARIRPYAIRAFRQYLFSPARIGVVGMGSLMDDSREHSGYRNLQTTKLVLQLTKDVHQIHSGGLHLRRLIKSTSSCI